MKIINLFSNRKHLIEQVKKLNAKAQKEFFELHAPALLMICRRYMKNDYDAEDVMLQGFLKIFNQIQQLQDDQKLQPWMKRIMVNTCLDSLRKQKIYFEDISAYDKGFDYEDLEVIDAIDVDQVIACLDNLPNGCRTIFNLYYVEGKKHKDIAELLNITQSTSKTQLSYAKKLLREMLTDKTNIKNKSI